MRHFNRIFILSFSLSSLLEVQLAWASSASSANTPQKFDIQSSRPPPGPRDIIIVAQSQPLTTETEAEEEKFKNDSNRRKYAKYFSFAAGAYLSFSLDPLSLFNGDNAKMFSVIKNRIELDVMAAIGIANWLELGVVLPVILFQQSDDDPTAAYNTHVRSTVFGDLSVIAKVPLLRRLPYQDGLGLALALRINLPTGSQSDFSSDGTVTFNPTVIIDYRFGFGGLIALQAGVHVRPGVSFMDEGGHTSFMNTVFTGALGVEVPLPLLRSRGLTALGGVYVNTVMDNIPAALTDAQGAVKSGQVAAEAMLGLRWYSKSGVTYTTGLNFGLDCALGIPSFRFFIAVVWTPKKFKEYQAILDFRDPPKSPEDTDKDGVLDVDDKCPLVKGQKRWLGCPTPAYLEGNRIFTLHPISFGLDSFVLLKAAMEVLDAVAQILKEHPEILLVEVGGHADPRGGEAINAPLTQKRAEAVVAYLVNLRGIAPSRLKAVGYGTSQPADPSEPGLEAYARDRRVAFRILQRAETDAGVPAPSPPSPQGPAPVSPPPAPTPEPEPSPQTLPVHPDQTPHASVEERLKKLKELHEKGLIDQGEYKKRQAEILTDT